MRSDPSARSQDLDRFGEIGDLTDVPSHRCASPPECEQALPQQSQRDAARREGSCSLTPMMRALIQLEETRATESRAPCKNPRPPSPLRTQTH